MTSTFNVHHAAGYDLLMGRWSRKLAPQFIRFAGVSNDERILDVGCGTGSLAFTLAEDPTLAAITAVDYSPIFVEAALARNKDPRVTIAQADASALPFEDHAFDRAMAQLVLPFIPEAQLAVSEMKRVTRPGGVIAAVAWDHFGGMPGFRMVIDTASALFAPARQFRAQFGLMSMTRLGEMADAFKGAGLRDVVETEMLLRMDFADFDDYWAAPAAGEGPFGKLMGMLSADQRDDLAKAVRDAYLSGGADGPRSFANIALAVRGTV